MPAHHTLHVALDATLVDYVRKQVAEGHYPNASQVVRAALHLLEQCDEQAQPNDEKIEITHV